MYNGHTYIYADTLYIHTKIDIQTYTIHAHTSHTTHTPHKPGCTYAKYRVVLMIHIRKGLHEHTDIQIVYTHITQHTHVSRSLDICIQTDNVCTHVTHHTYMCTRQIYKHIHTCVHTQCMHTRHAPHIHHTYILAIYDTYIYDT